MSREYTYVFIDDMGPDLTSAQYMLIDSWFVKFCEMIPNCNIELRSTRTVRENWIYELMKKQQAVGAPPGEEGHVST